MKKQYLIGALLIGLSLTFFGFIDDRFRGWEDTNQYQLEAKAWSKGSRPPVEQMLADKASHVGPTHVGPLTPFVWSFLISADGDYHESLKRIKILQAFLVAACFLGMALVLGSWDFSAFALVVIFFFNGFFREMISIPVTEPLALALLIVSYLWPKFSGVAVVLEAMVRPPMILLFIPNLWRQRKSWKAIVASVVTALVCILLFKNLVIPSSFQGSGISFHKSIDILRGFSHNLSEHLFSHLLPYHNGFFQWAWRIVLYVSFLILLINKRKHRWVWLASALYFITILLPYDQGVRYFIPMLAMWLMEFKPQFPRTKWVRVVTAIFCLHLIIRQVDSIAEFKRFAIPETETPGLVKTRQWLKDNNAAGENLLMGRFRYCVNYFETKCYGFALNFKDPVNDLKAKNIRYIILTSVDWYTEEKQFEKQLIDSLKAKGKSLPPAIQFEDIRIFDVNKI